MDNKYNAYKILYHGEALAALAEGRRQAPIHVRVKPTNTCNHHCDYCSYGAGSLENKGYNRDQIIKADQIPWTVMLDFIKDIHKMKIKAVTFSGGGEPLTYPHIVETVTELKKGGTHLSLITNGQLLKGRLAELFADVKWVRVSFDSPVASEYAAQRNISVSAHTEVCDNLAAFATGKSGNCVLGVNFVITKANHARVYQAAGLLKELGVDHVKFSAVVSSQPGYHNEIKEKVLKQLESARQDFATESFAIVNAFQNECGNLSVSRPPLSKCYICELCTVLGADSKLYLCHTRAYDSRAMIGDISKTPFRDVWFSSNSSVRRTKLVPFQQCQNICAYYDRNKTLEHYFSVDLNHVNFL